MSFQAYLDNIKMKTGKTAADFKKLAEKKGLLKPTVKAGEIVDWLKKDFELGHGHAMAIYAVLKGTKTPEAADKKETGEFPVKLSKPAQRALAGASINTLKQAAKLSEEELSALHGIGQNAVQQIKKALSDQGLSFANKKK
jgi:DNA-directed RNA polymerase alpha subunit